MDAVGIALAAWVLGSVPLAVVVGRLLHRADRIAVAAEHAERRAA